MYFLIYIYGALVYFLSSSVLPDIYIGSSSVLPDIYIYIWSSSVLREL